MWMLLERLIVIKLQEHVPQDFPSAYSDNIQTEIGDDGQSAMETWLTVNDICLRSSYVFSGCDTRATIFEQSREIAAASKRDDKTPGIKGYVLRQKLCVREFTINPRS